MEEWSKENMETKERTRTKERCKSGKDARRNEKVKKVTNDGSKGKRKERKMDTKNHETK